MKPSRPLTDDASEAFDGLVGGVSSVCQTFPMIRGRGHLSLAPGGTRAPSLIDKPFKDRKSEAGPCNQQRPHHGGGRKKRQAKRQAGGIEDLHFTYCPNPIHKIEHKAAVEAAKAGGRYSWWASMGRWHTMLRFPRNGRTDTVECEVCGAVMPRINERPKVAA